MTRQLKRIAKQIINTTGFEVRRTKELAAYAPDIRHMEVIPSATYSPWLSDDEFKRVYDLARTNTLVDRYRCYELWQLVGEAAKLPSGDLIEIGVWRGGTGALIARRCQLAGIQNAIYLCDTFTGVVKAGRLDASYVGGEHADTSQETAQDLMDNLGLDRVRILKGVFPEECGALIGDSVFRFCHIDVDVYDSAKEIVDWIWPRLLRGGIIVYDDYGFHSCVGITRFVNEERCKPDRFVIHNLNGHAIVIKKD